MSKEIPCFICGEVCIAKSDEAIAKLCKEHDNAENRKTMANTPYHKLLKKLNDYTNTKVEASKGEVDALKKRISELEKLLKNQKPEKEVIIEKTTNYSGNVNEYGEIE